MQQVEPPDAFCLSSAIGWLELGNFPEAKAELSLISAANQNHPDVLELRWAICAEEQNWVEALEVARALIQADPKRSSGWLHQAYALRRVPDGSIQKAWDALLPAADKFPDDATIPFNLSCYACQMEQLNTARLWLKRAFSVGGRERIKNQALRDPDLASLWEEIRTY